MDLLASHELELSGAVGDAVAPPGDGSAHARRVEELGRIIMAYSEVTERLQEAHEQLTATVESLRQELGEKNRLLERRNRLAALGEMAAGLAHEIRNPLGGINLYASMVAKDVAAMPPTLAAVRKISAGVRRLEGLVSQVLNFSREITAAPGPCDLAEVVAAAVDLAAPTAAARDVTIGVDGPASLPVVADEALVGQAVLNLVLNAAEAVPAGGRVWVSHGPPPTGTGARQFCLVVRDDGPGIAPDVLDRIFNPFFTTKDTGTGLGLSIVHRIVEAHDGIVTAGNAEGGGARFEVRV